MKNNYYESPKAGWLMRLFWKAAGADRYLLEKSTYSDQVKYFCLGGIVVATGVLAGIAGGYAFYTIFEPKGLAFDSYIMETFKVSNQEVAQYREMAHYPTVFKALFFGLIWGLVIFNIDRFIVTSTGKGDGTEKITRDEFFGAIPRIIMGMIIALTISKPVEIRMFKSEIDVKLYEKQKEKELELRATIERKYDDKFKENSKEFDRVRKDREKLEENLLKSSEIYREKADNTVPVRYNKGTVENPVWVSYKKEAPYVKAYKDQMEQARKDLDDFNIKNSDALKRMQDLKEKLQAEKEFEEQNSDKVISGLDGLLERIKLAHEVAGWGISLFITLLFMVIELTPIFFKMMLIKSPYDYMDENVKELARAEAGIEIEYDFYKDKEGVEKHKVINHAAEAKRKEKLAMLKAQEELNAEIIKEWTARKKADIKENPDKYISES